MLKFLHILTICSALILSACSDQENDSQKITIVSADGQTVISEYSVEIADTIEKSRRGLMGRVSLPEHAGMLFNINIVPNDMEIAFWMKDTLIPLDMVFIDENGVIFYIYENAKPQDTSTIMAPRRPTGVLEINGGQVALKGIKQGDIVRHKIFNN